MLRPCLPRIGRALMTSRRSIHHMPALSHDFSKGVPEFLGPLAFELSWTRYQQLMLDELNKITVGTSHENKDTKEVLLKFARDPNHAATFNYASMAHNNHFFFQGLSPKTTAIPEALRRDLLNSFSSLETLQQELTITAASMFGPGFVWLVMDKSRKFSILSTYMAGTPYPAAHYRKQPVDMNTEDQSVSDAVRRMNSMPVSNTVGAHGAASRPQNLAPGALDLTPVLCVNTWEHVYLVDYGVGAYDPRTGTKVGGKRAFVEEWWNKIDWNIVADRASSSSKPYMT